MRMIDMLEKPDCVAILTGQQVGLFGGPIYTFYKAVTATRIAEELRKEGIPAVAVFWMEGEDHDLAEVTRCSFFHPRLGIKTIDYAKILFDQAAVAARSVGCIRFPESIKQAVADYLAFVPEAKWKPQVGSILETSYHPGATFTQAFARMMAQIFYPAGLILYDPQTSQTKQMASSLLKKALLDAEMIRNALLECNRELVSAGFHCQVRILENATLLFLTINGKRCALEKKPGGFGIKNSHRLLSLAQILKFVEQNPESFSPNVLLRPVIQDYLFPTVAYVAGPSELAYFAQARVVYEVFGRDMPVLWPRASFTLIEPEVALEMQRLGIEIQDCFCEREFLMEKAIRNLGSAASLEIIDRLYGQLDSTLSELGPELRSLDPTLVQALETAQRKALHNLHRLKRKIITWETEQHSPLAKVLDLLHCYCFPNRQLQERCFGLPSFLAVHGPSLLEILRSTTEISNFSHRLIWLENQP